MQGGPKHGIVSSNPGVMPEHGAEISYNNLPRDHARLLPRDPPRGNPYVPAFGQGHQATRAVSRKRPTRRERASTACERCRSKKLKCEGRPICTYCHKHGTPCKYSTSTKPAESIPSTAFLLGRIAALEEKLHTLTQEPLLPGIVNQREPGPSNAGSNSIEVGNGQGPYLTPSTSSVVTDTPSISSKQHFELQTSFGQDEDAPENIPDGERDECLTRSGEAFDLDTPSATIQDVGQLDLTSTGSILPLVEHYLRLVCPLFPIICDQVLWETASTVAATGFKKDLSSCMTSFAMLLAKAYSPSSIESCDLSLFTEARQLLSSLPVKLTLEYAQTQILCSIFLLKRHQLLDSWQWLHAGCTTLYAMVRWDESRKVQKTQVEKNTILRMFWICYNLERDLTTEIDVLPRSHLSKLEDQMPLPLGCDESTLSHLERSTRIIYLFFLAETSLKEIVARINTMCLETLPELGRKSAKVRISPVALELKNQLVVWEESVPQSLGWSPQPSEDACSALHTRLKLIYWLAQFHLFEPLVMAVMNNVHAEFNFDVWSSVVHGLSAGYTLVKVLVWEKTQVDSVMGKRIQAVISFLENAADKTRLQELQPKQAKEILKLGKQVLEEQVKGNSGTWPWEF